MTERYGVQYAAQNPEIHAAQQKSCRRNYGVNCIFSDSDFIKRGIKRYKKNAKLYIGRRVKTMLERYGVAHASQSRDMHERQQRSGFKQRKFTIKGKDFATRGYEDIAINYLATVLKIPVTDIKTTAAEGVPSIPWKDASGKSHVYHPDIYVKLDNRWYLVEVKSQYTAGILKDSHKLFDTLRTKVRSSVSSGYRMKVFIVNPSQRNSKEYYVSEFASSDILRYTRSEIRELVAS